MHLKRLQNRTTDTCLNLVIEVDVIVHLQCYVCLCTFFPLTGSQLERLCPVEEFLDL